MRYRAAVRAVLITPEREVLLDRFVKNPSAAWATSRPTFTSAATKLQRSRACCAHVRADARIAEQAAEITEQRAQSEALRRQVAKLGRNSGNSNRPPSSNSPQARADRKSRSGQGKRGRGGQPRHRDSRRTLLAAEHVDDVVDMFPEHCGIAAKRCPRRLILTPNATSSPSCSRPSRTQSFGGTRCCVSCSEWRRRGRRARAPKGRAGAPLGRSLAGSSRGECERCYFRDSLHLLRREGPSIC